MDRLWNVLAGFALVLVAAIALGQSGGGTGPAFVAVQAGAPSSPADGHQWIRSSDQRLFNYDATLDKWLGPEEIWVLARNTADQTGFINIPGNIQCDTTTGVEEGWRADATMRLMKVVGSTVTATASTTYIFASQDTIAKLIWDADSSGQQSWTPQADSSQGFWAPSDRVIVSVGKYLIASHVDSAGPGPERPDANIMAFYMREEETP
jgi:hypothetical protein